MSIENGEWVMHGVAADDPACLHTVEELEDYVNTVGFVPLFAGEVTGFSVEERTVPENWWSDDIEKDPWMWRQLIASRGNIAYGKFFNNRAGFISKEWLPVFANYRRDGYDFDARWDDELASARQKKIMDLFMEENADNELFSFETKEKSGFSKGGEKNFEGTVSSLQMMTYLVCRDFRQRTNKKGAAYGWHIAVYCTPEHAFGAEVVTSAYDEDPKVSLEKLVSRVHQFFPDVNRDSIIRLLALPEDRPAAKKGKLPWPQNLLHVLDKEKDPWSWTPDQVDGLTVALGQLRSKYQNVLFQKYRDGLTNANLALKLGKKESSVSSMTSTGLTKLRYSWNAAWYRDGYEKNFCACAWSRHWNMPELANWHPAPTIGPDDYALRLGIKVSNYEYLMASDIRTISDLVQRSQKPDWYREIRGIGPKTAAEIEQKLKDVGFIE